MYKYDSETGYTVSPNLRYSNPTKPPKNAPRKIHFVDVRTDKNGFLFTGDLEQAAKTDKLIFCLGGSTTMGLESRHDKTYPARLDKLVQSLGYSCINSGVGGARSIHELLILKHKILRYKPKIIILFSGFNDYESYSYQLSVSDPNDPFKHYMSSFLNRTAMEKLFDRSCLIHGVLSSVRKAIKRRRPFDIKVSSKAALKDLKWLEAWKNNVGKMIDLCVEHQVKFCLISHPSPVYRNATQQAKDFANLEVEMAGRFDDWVEFYNIIYEESQLICNDKSVQFIDVNEAFEKYLSQYNGAEHYRQRYKLFTDRVHFSEKGNQLLATSIFHQIKEYL
ncbi:MAG: hypothetical protein GY777_07810 [Candidatus Brocadiaceae bacterium]|nr:hypothetical protein [Candidatus Brocadiaceae bacterium]